MRLDISWYNQFSSKRTKGVIFNSTGEERWGGKAISKYTITSQTETSNPNITRHAPHQRQIKIENKWRETTAQKLDWEERIEEAFYKILSLAIIWYQTLWWPRVADPLNYPVINTFSATQTLTWTQFVQTLTLSDFIKRLTASPLIISGLSAKLDGKPAIFVIMMFLQKISMRKWETFTLGGP